MIYVIDKDLSIVKLTGYDLEKVKAAIQELGLTNYEILTEINTMNYVSRIYKVDNIVIYNNPSFWKTNAQNIINDYSNHIVVDFLEKPVGLDQFKNEYYNNATRIEITKEGIAAQIQYNRIIGGEFIDIFREECIVYDAQALGMNEAAIMTKVKDMVDLLIAGAFHSAVDFLNYLKTNPDEFLTIERISKYIVMLESADSITYNK
jgi:hypothetical protein